MAMRFALFLGCNIPVRLKCYELSTRAVLSQLGVDLVDIPEFNCCGYPLRNIHREAFVLSAARNMALAGRRNLDILSLCQCGFGTFRMAQHLLERDAGLRERVRNDLAKEGLAYEEKINVRHLLSVLYHDIGVDAIRRKIGFPFENLQVAVHYGCHGLRPSNIMQFDDPVAPTIFDRLVEATGGESVVWPLKLDCCGGPLSGTHDSLSMDFAEKKMEDARRAGAHCIATACPYCQIQFDAVPKRMAFERGEDLRVPAILYPQLLGLGMGIDMDALGIDSIRGRIADFRRRLAA